MVGATGFEKSAPDENPPQFAEKSFPLTEKLTGHDSALEFVIKNWHILPPEVKQTIAALVARFGGAE